MDWQHLIMNGESLAEYAALLASKGLLGHQHANSGWGTFDDDNMVGATAFMETLELALEFRRAGYGDDGRAARVRPVPVHRGRGRGGAALGAAVAVHRRRRREDRRRRAARGAVPQGRGAGVRARVRRARRLTLVGLDVGTTGVKAIRISETGEVLARHEEEYPLSIPQPGWAEQDPEDWWRATRAGARRGRRGDGPSG